MHIFFRNSFGLVSITYLDPYRKRYEKDFFFFNIKFITMITNAFQNFQLDWAAFAVMTLPSLGIPFLLWWSSKSKYEAIQLKKD